MDSEEKERLEFLLRETENSRKRVIDHRDKLADAMRAVLDGAKPLSSLRDALEEVFPSFAGPEADTKRSRTLPAPGLSNDGEGDPR